MVIKQHTLCAVCRRPCELGSCVTDEWGRAVHASCYQKKVTKGNSNAPGGYEEVEEILQQTRELREIADQLIKEIGSPDKSLQTAHRPGQAPSAPELNAGVANSRQLIAVAITGDLASRPRRCFAAPVPGGLLEGEVVLHVALAAHLFDARALAVLL